MRDVAIVSFAQSGARGRRRGDRDAAAVPGRHRGHRAVGHPAQGDRVHVLGQRRLPRGCAVRVRRQPRGDRRVAADLGVARRDGRRVGAVRSVGAAPARRRRRRARVLVGHLLARQPARGAVPAERPVLPDAAVGRPRVARGAAGTRAASTRTARRRPTSPRSRRAVDATRVSNPNAQVSGDQSADELLAEPYVVSPLRPSDCPPVTDGAAAVDPRRRRPRTRGHRAARVDPRDRPPRRSPLHRRARPEPVRVGTARGRARRRRRGTRRGRRARRGVQPRGAHPARRARSRRRRGGQPLGRRARAPTR